MVKRARHNSYPVKKPTVTGNRHHGPPTITLANIPTSKHHDQLKLSGIEYHWVESGPQAAISSLG